ncbi:tRNA modification GTPase gtpbp3, mitochondrial [Balamuthia mandrillaris]
MKKEILATTMCGSRFLGSGPRSASVLLPSCCLRRTFSTFRFSSSSLNLLAPRARSFRLLSSCFQLRCNNKSAALMSSPSLFWQKRIYSEVGGILGSSADTIFALSSGRGKAGVAVVRLSGCEAKATLSQLTSPPAHLSQEEEGERSKCTLPPPRKAVLRRFFHPTKGELLDEGLVLWFPGPHSYTGEDMVELHLHGSIAVVNDTLSALSSIGLRSAAPGEFTRRAFQNGKKDLTEVEGIADLVEAETEAQRRQALRQMGGALSKLCQEWRHELLSSLAYVEAVIDFGEDEDLDSDLDDGDIDAANARQERSSGVLDSVAERLAALRSAIASHLNDQRRGERMRHGLSLAIVGPPNAGKSSLLNILAQRQAAIVSPIPGTTRDIIETQLDLGGYPVCISDTAGLRVSSDLIEQEGVKLAKERFLSSDLKICMFDVASLAGNNPPEDIPIIRELLTGNPSAQESASEDSRMVIVLNKADLLPPERMKELSNGANNSLLSPFLHNKGIKATREILFVSCKTGWQVDQLLQHLQQTVKQFFEGNNNIEAGGGSAVVTRSRHREYLSKCVAHLDTALSYDDDNNSNNNNEIRRKRPFLKASQLEVAAEEVRQAVRCLAQLTGSVDVEQVLDVVFKDFCIGK